MKSTHRFHQPALLLLAVFAVTGLASCSKKPPTPPQPKWAFEPKAIWLKYVADPTLNVYEGQPHTLVLQVYQLSDVNAFNDLTKTPEGLKTLLHGTHFDPTVVSTDQYFVQPGEEKTLTLFRAQNAQYVGLVAGYYQLVPGAVNRMLSIPVIIEKQGLIRKSSTAKVDHLTVTLYLGQRAIQEIDPYTSPDGN